MNKTVFNKDFPRKIIISRTDKIGDVILTLPLAAYLKAHYPETEIIFLGKTYTAPILENYEFINAFINYDELIRLPEKEQLKRISETGADAFIHVFPQKHLARLAKKAGIKTRIGTSHRKYHWLTCNKLINFTRKRSDLHESQLNFELLKGLGIKEIPAISSICDYFGKEHFKLKPSGEGLPNRDSITNVILHPGSRGSAREWGHENFAKLASLLPEDQFRIWLSGSKEEGLQSTAIFDSHHIKYQDISGMFSLDQLMSFIAENDVLVAASTGPLHIAAALDVLAIGLFPPIRPMHPGRWAPVGKKTKVFVNDKTCNDCRKSTICECMKSISPEEVARFIKEYFSHESINTKS